MKSIKVVAKNILSILQSTFLSYPKNIQCNICRWEGRHFLSDSWHKQINCPRCHSSIRQRLFFAALQNIENYSLDRLIHDKKILHFAPEDVISSIVMSKAIQYVTADLLRINCDFRLNMSDMPEIKDESFDLVIAFDVLEHVPDYGKALKEIHRILRPKGFTILTVPQKDKLLATYEDKSIVTPEGRTKHFGQWDHLRIFGSDFSKYVGEMGFSVDTINDSFFSKEMRKKYVLYPPIPSKHPLATNYRNVFFCQKMV